VTYHQTLHALRITTGEEALGGPVDIQAAVMNDSGQTVTFDPQAYKERAALTLVNGVVYTAWASHCDAGSAHGWVIGYNAATLQQVSVFNTTPNYLLSTIWQSNGGPAADSDGNLYFETGNGVDVPPPGDDYSEAFLRLNGRDGQTVDDYFIPYNYAELDELDEDVGSGAPIVLPDQPGDHRHLLIGAGKEGTVYLIDRDHMGKLNNPPFGPDLVVQELPNAIGSCFDTPAYFDGGDPNGPWIYYAGYADNLKAFQLTNGRFTSATPTSQSPNVFLDYYGATPVVSALGTRNGIVWALESGGPAVLHAYDATDLSRELYNSNQSANDQLGDGVRFNSPIVADGKVFVPGSNYVGVFGLLSSGPTGTAARGGKPPFANPATAAKTLLFASEGVSRLTVPLPAVRTPDVSPSDLATLAPRWQGTKPLPSNHFTDQFATWPPAGRVSAEGLLVRRWLRTAPAARRSAESWLPPQHSSGAESTWATFVPSWYEWTDD
jgi:hypothetical protein